MFRYIFFIPIILSLYGCKSDNELQHIYQESNTNLSFSCLINSYINNYSLDDFKKHVKEVGDRPESKAALQKAHKIHLASVDINIYIDSLLKNPESINRDFFKYMLDKYVKDLNQKTGLKLPLFSSQIIKPTSKTDTAILYLLLFEVKRYEAEALKELGVGASSSFCGYRSPPEVVYVHSSHIIPEGDYYEADIFWMLDLSFLQTAMKVNGQPLKKIVNSVGYVEIPAQRVWESGDTTKLFQEITINKAGKDTTFIKESYFRVFQR